ncbi:hypothetical protein BH09PAT3_BH09PAT3_3520 [soil metagenome]
MESVKVEVTSDEAAFAVEQAMQQLQPEGGLSGHVNRYEGDMSKCPFLNSLGAAGIELGQRLQAEAEEADEPELSFADLFALEDAAVKPTVAQKEAAPSISYTASETQQTLTEVYANQNPIPHTEAVNIDAPVAIVPTTEKPTINVIDPPVEEVIALHTLLNEQEPVEVETSSSAIRTVHRPMPSVRPYNESLVVAEAAVAPPSPVTELEVESGPSFQAAPPHVEAAAMTVYEDNAALDQPSIAELIEYANLEPAAFAETIAAPETEELFVDAPVESQSEFAALNFEVDVSYEAMELPPVYAYQIEAHEEAVAPTVHVIESPSYQTEKVIDAILHETGVSIEPAYKTRVETIVEELTQFMYIESELSSAEATIAVAEICDELFDLIGITADATVRRALVREIVQLFQGELAENEIVELSDATVNDEGTHEYKLTLLATLLQYVSHAAHDKTERLMTLNKYLFAHLSSVRVYEARAI